LAHRVIRGTATFR